MNPKRDAEGFAIDHYSNDLEGAAQFQREYNGHLLMNEDYFEEDYDIESDDEEDDDDWDDCGCSDPCCPCSGSKVGWP
jgi:hypothetical protein